MLDIDFEVSGPLFNGEADAALADYCRAVERKLGDEGEHLVRQHLHAVIRHPTGYYEAHIRNRATTSGHEVTDSRVIYGPWLEGVGERNRSTPFKGYATFRTASGQLSRQAPYHAQTIIAPYLARMGG